MDPHKKIEIKSQNQIGKLTVKSYRLYEYEIKGSEEKSLSSPGYQIPFQAINIKRVKAGKVIRIPYKKKTVYETSSNQHGKIYISTQPICDGVMYTYKEKGKSKINQQ